MLSRMMDQQRAMLLIGLGLVAGSSALYAFYGQGVLVAFATIVLIYVTIKLGAGPFARMGARVPVSLRWKISGTIFLMLGVLLGASLVGLVALNHTHGQIISIQESRDTAVQPAVAAILREVQGPEGELLRQMQTRNAQMSTAIDRLENTVREILSWIPAVVLMGGLIAVGLGAALSSSLLRPLQSMSAATRRIARGDFSNPVVVRNRDEMGELANSLNNAAQDLGRLQEALLAEERARSLQERITQATLAQEEERRRISRELHDGLGPSLADLGNRLSVCRQLVQSNPAKVEAGLDEVTALLRSHIEEIRELINQLRPLALDQLGLVEALRQYVERFGEESEVRASLAVSGALPTDPLTEVTIYRVVQESLTNVQKHAQAAEVKVMVNRSDDGVEVTVSDDGHGFDLENVAARASNGIGLTSMRERAELVGGSFTVQSSPGHGCQTVLHIPARG